MSSSETGSEQREGVQKQEKVRITIPPDIDPRSFELDLMTSADGGSFIFSGPPKDKFPGKQGILKAMRGGKDVQVTINNPSEGDVIVLHKKGRGKGRNRKLHFTRTTIFRYTKEHGWQKPEAILELR